MEKNQSVLDLLAEMAEAKQATSAQIVLAWELAQRDYIVPIPGTTKIYRLEENLGAMDITLSGEDIKKINLSLEQMEIDETHF